LYPQKGQNWEWATQLMFMLISYTAASLPVSQITS